MRKFVSHTAFLLMITIFSGSAFACGEFLSPEKWQRANLHPAKDSVCPTQRSGSRNVRAFCELINEELEPEVSFDVTMQSFKILCDRGDLWRVDMEVFWRIANGEKQSDVGDFYADPSGLKKRLQRLRDNVAFEFNKIKRLCLTSIFADLENCDYLNRNPW